MSNHHMKMNRYTLATLVVAVALMVGIIVGVVGVQAQDGSSARLDPIPAGPAYQPDTAEVATADLYNSVAPSVVFITVIGNRGGGSGSGFVIDSQGHIVTNNHVVEGGEFIRVTFIDGVALDADLIGRDPDSDLAVLRVDPAAHSLQPLALADSDNVFVGQDVLAIGSPFGQEFTLTTGIVSGLDRSLPQQNRFTLPELIQTDAAINPGNSGGPLLDRDGKVVGVNTAILGGTRTSSGVGFAIPSNTVRRVVPYLMADGTYAHSWLGISGTTAGPEVQEAMGLSSDITGVIVTMVPNGGPASQAGLRPATGTAQTPFGGVPVNGDIITAINGENVFNMTDLIGYLETQTLPGDTVTLRVWRDGSLIDVPVTLQERPTQ